MTKPIAHASDDGRIHFLEDHLRDTADLTALFAGEFGAGGVGKSGHSMTLFGKVPPAILELFHIVIKNSNKMCLKIRKSNHV